MSLIQTSLLIPEEEVETIERQFPDGLTSHQLVELFRSRGARFSEATLRKYVQLGLLPRSHRVGLKGKHRGSQGLYPVETVRRVNRIKQWMGDNQTIEHVRELLAQSIDLAGFRKELEQVLAGLQKRLESGGARGGSTAKQQITQLRQSAEALIGRIEQLDKQIRPQVKRPMVAVPPAPPRVELGNRATRPKRRERRLHE